MTLGTHSEFTSTKFLFAKVGAPAPYFLTVSVHRSPLSSAVAFTSYYFPMSYPSGMMIPVRNYWSEVQGARSSSNRTPQVDAHAGRTVDASCGSRVAQWEITWPQPRDFKRYANRKHVGNFTL